MKLNTIWAILCLVPLQMASALLQAENYDTLAIYQIQGEGNTSPVSGQTLVTNGVVTLTLFGENQRKGFFVQDTAGDANPATSDGIFVYGEQDVEPGDYVYVTGKVGEYANRTQLSGVLNVDVVGKDVEIPFQEVVFPDDLEGKYESMEGMALCFTQRLYLNSTYQLQKYGQLSLGSQRLRSATDVCLPASPEYEELLASNERDELLLDDGSSYSNPSPIPFLDNDGTCRTGQTLNRFKAVLDQEESRYMVYSVGEPQWEGNSRSLVPPLENLGKHDLRIVGFNLEYFYNDEPVQTARIMSALWAMQADVFALVEVGGGKQIIQALVDSLNRRDASQDYAYVAWSGHEPASDYTMNHLVYRQSKVEPYRNSYMVNDVSPYNRKLIQCFTHKASGQRFIMSVCHFKAKSGSGSGQDADQGDGQGVFNYQRVREAYAMKNRLSELRYYYGTENILLMGDLNSLYREDPIRIFTDNGYVEQVHRFSDSNYSYVFDGRVQYLDYALASASMQAFVTGADIWHINADEPSFLDYERDPNAGRGPFRSSDHDPVLVGLDFSAASSQEEGNLPMYPDASLRVYPNPAKDRIRIEWNALSSFEEGGELQLFSADGRLCFHQRIHPGTGSVVEYELGNLAPGVYVWRFLPDGGSVPTSARMLKVR